MTCHCWLLLTRYLRDENRAAHHETAQCNLLLATLMCALATLLYAPDLRTILYALSTLVLLLLDGRLLLALLRKRTYTTHYQA